MTAGRSQQTRDTTGLGGHRTSAVDSHVLNHGRLVWASLLDPELRCRQLRRVPVEPAIP
jgi:hypothetical protein